MKPKWIVMAAIVVFLLAVGMFWRLKGHSAAGQRSGIALADTRPADPAPVQVIRMRLQNVPQWWNATGTVSAQFQAGVGAKISGKIQQVFVHEGQYVHKGQVLATLESHDLSAQVAQAAAALETAQSGYRSAQVALQMERLTSQAQIRQASAGELAAQARLDETLAGLRRQQKEQANYAVNQAQAAYTLASANFRRMSQLFAQEAISKQQFDAAKSDLDTSRAQLQIAQQSQNMAQEGSRKEDIQAARAALNEAKASLAQARAAAAQVLMRRQAVQAALTQIAQSRANLQLSRVMESYAVIRAPFYGVITKRSVDPGMVVSSFFPSPLLTEEGGEMRLNAVVPESALAYVKVGDTVPVRIDGFDGKVFDGLVVEISPQGDPTSHTFIVKLRLSPNAGIRSGQFGHAGFQIGTQRAYLVPATAIHSVDGMDVVYVVDKNNRARMRIVTLGASSPSGTVVLSGLSDGDWVVAAPGSDIHDGASITPVKE